MNNDVIISIHEDATKKQMHKLSADSPARKSSDSTVSAQNPAAASCPSSPTPMIPSKPPKIPKCKSLSISRSYSKPKSRFGEQSIPIEANTVQNRALLEDVPFSSHASPSAYIKEINRSISISRKTPPASSPGGVGGLDKDEEIYIKVSSMRKIKYRKVKVKVSIEWLLFLCILGCLILSLTVERLKHFSIWELRLSRWFLLVLVTFSGMLVTKWLMHFVVLLIELNYLLKKKVLYFVHGLKKSVQFTIWLSLVLLTWILLFRGGVKRSRLATKILDFVTWSIASLLIGSFLWVLKTLLLNIFASSFHVNTSLIGTKNQPIINTYILMTQSAPPVLEPTGVSRLSSFVPKKGNDIKEKKGKAKRVINILNKASPDEAGQGLMLGP